MSKHFRLIIALYLGFSFALLSGEFSKGDEKNVKFSQELELDLQSISLVESCLAGRKTSPKERLMAFLSPKKKSSPKKEIGVENSEEEEIVISPRTRTQKKCLNTQNPGYPLGQTISLKRSASLDNKLYSIQSVRIAPKADSLVYLKCVDGFNFPKIKDQDLINELFCLIDYHGFEIIKAQSLKARESTTRNSACFNREYDILRSLWAPEIKSALSERFKRLDFHLLVREWNQIEVFQNYIAVEKNSKLGMSSQDFEQNEWGPVKEKIGLWEKRRGAKVHNPDEIVLSPRTKEIASREELREMIDQSTLSQAQKSYLSFLTEDISSIIENAKVEYRIFFIELYLALACDYKGNKIISSEKAKYMTLNNLFLYVIQLALFDIRVEQTSFNKIEIGEFALEVLKDFSSRADLSEDEEDQLVLNIISRMRKEATKRLQGSDFFEIQLMQLLQQTFGVLEKRNFSEYQVILDAIKDRMIHFLLLL